MGYFCNFICHQELSKTAESGPTVTSLDRFAEFEIQQWLLKSFITLIRSQAALEYWVPTQSKDCLIAIYDGGTHEREREYCKFFQLYLKNGVALMF